ncbi:tetratricopeptide repeat protein [Marinifilum caeruleilacunae]|uniref:Tetratricopeptide repeat protein n=1 Tax=Marinifilum caeruleilacunae TaxID=2499076 RepID=A0ABX1WRV0_9BACT|nr:tetratricopeptide repeat protein [Marinifilum caeruleilacunae]NOU58824.1 tetratricopeptide repeat protein [Marinifilum caeruleilacunae]
MKKILTSLLLISLISGTLSVFGQLNIQSGSSLAFKYFRDKEYKPASTLFYDLYDVTKSKTYYNYYIDCLLALEEFKDAESFVKKQIRKNPNDNSFLISLGYVYKKWNQEEQAVLQFNKAIEKLKPIKVDINNAANAFIAKREYDFAAKVYQKGRELLQQPHLYHLELGNIYLYQRDFEKMLAEFLIAVSIDPTKVSTVQNRLQSALNQDIDSSLDPIIRNQLLNKMRTEPDNFALKELLQWYFMQKKQFQPALAQARSIDLIKKEDGFRLMTLGFTARTNKDFETAIEAFQLVIDKGPEVSNFLRAKIELLETNYLQLQESKTAKQEDWQKLATDYDSFLNKEKNIGQTSKAIVRYSHILSAYLNQSDKAIEKLEAVLKVRSIHPQYKSEIKMELADIKLFADEKWDAILLYSQLEKANKNNTIGFEAKFKKAKVSYYMGELKWAKAQLDALKGSTSKLIANDAIALSQLINDNTTLDTSYTAMKTYAEADFLLYQKKEEAALNKLDELIRNQPAHSLIDEVYLKKYEIYYQQNQLEKALENLEKIINDHPWDSLADKALFKKGELLEKMQNASAAMDCYKSIITDYPDSIFSVEARQKLNALRQ